MYRRSVAVLGMTVGLAYAGDEAQLIEKLNHIHSLKANFTQVVRQKTHIVQRSDGTMAFKRPGKFRFDTKQPMRELLLADGKKVWIYSPELEQVIVKAQVNALKGTPALFLTESNQVMTEDYTVKAVKPGYFLLTATSQAPTFAHIQFAFQADLLQSITLEDALGQKTEIQLHEVRQNIKMDEHRFEFKPPRGVDVIRE